MEKIKVIWISMYAPVSFASSGGGQTFNFYFKKFATDALFDIKLISCGKYLEKEKVEADLNNIDHQIVYWGSPDRSKIRKLLNVESKYNPWNANANMIANADVIEILDKFKMLLKEGFQPDVIILEWTPIVFLASNIHQLYPKAKIIASEHDVTYIGLERKSKYHSGIKQKIWNQKYQWEKKKEISALKYCDLILPHNSDNISSLVEEGIQESKLVWLVPYFNNMGSCIRNSNHRDILFYGAMSRPENYLSAIWFIDNVMPLLNDLDVRFVILGSNPPKEIKELASERICVTGFVESVEPYFETSMCLVAPLLLGAGIKVKVIEALSSGIPVLTNNIGIEGIHAENEKEYFHCEEPKEYEYIIRQLVSNQIDETNLTVNERDFINQTFSPEKCQLMYKNKIIEIVGSNIDES